MNIPTPQELKETENKISIGYAEQLINNTLFSIEHAFKNGDITSRGGEIDLPCYNGIDHALPVINEELQKFGWIASVKREDDVYFKKTSKDEKNWYRYKLEIKPTITKPEPPKTRCIKEGSDEVRYV